MVNLVPPFWGDGRNVGSIAEQLLVCVEKKNKMRITKVNAFIKILPKFALACLICLV